MAIAAMTTLRRTLVVVASAANTTALRPARRAPAKPMLPSVVTLGGKQRKVLRPIIGGVSVPVMDDLYRM